MIPLRTDTPVRRVPLANYFLLAANVLIFVIFDVAGRNITSLQQFKLDVSLNAALPEWWQFFSYAFLHDDFWHLAGNMLFLWVFGNSVNAKFGDLSYTLFYLAAGAFAGWGFSITGDSRLIGASGSIAAVTLSYMVLFPKSRILFLFWFFIITTFELPAVWVILLKIVLWDNLVSPALSAGDGGVAYTAHLYGYLYGFVATLGMLLFGALSRDQFDLLAILKRWNQRRAYAAMMSDPQAKARAQYGTVARPITLDPQKQRQIQARLDTIAELRGKIHEILARRTGHEAAVDQYEQLMLVDPSQCLPRQQQSQIAKLLYAVNKFPQAAAAFEKYLRHYPKSHDSEEVRLLLGIIYARDLSQYEAAEGHLKKALDTLTDPARRDQCQQWLDRVLHMLRPAPPDAG